MPPKLRRASAKETIRALERLGFVQTRQRGSHIILKRKASECELTCVVPLHGSTIPIGTILKQAGVTPEEFMEHL